MAANGEVKSLSTDLLGYEVKHIAPDELKVKGLQGNVYVGRSNKEYVKIDGLLYESRLKEGQRVIRHAGGTAADIPVRDLGVSGWEPTSRANRLLGGVDTPPTPWRLGDSTYVVPMDGIKKQKTPYLPIRSITRRRNIMSSLTVPPAPGKPLILKGRTPCISGERAKVNGSGERSMTL